MILNTDEFSKFANSLADDASKTSMHYFRNKIEIEIKDDESPVTLADKETEQVLRERIRKEYPDHGILGEEYENEKIDSEFLWVLDPIDGTRSYIAGHKDFGNLIALLHNKKPVLGIINCPAHGERWIGVKNQKTKCNGKNVQTSAIKQIKDAYLFTSRCKKIGIFNLFNCTSLNIFSITFCFLIFYSYPSLTMCRAINNS